MAGNPLTATKFRGFTTSNAPLAGGKLYSYEAGTSTPLATYTTRALSVANANPVVLDANGEAEVWLTPGVLYKFELKTSADVLLSTTDNFPSPASEDGSSDIAATDPGGRLSLTSGLAVTSSDVTGGTSVYYVPYKHNKVPIYDGSAWSLHSVATELSQTTSDATKSPAAVANNSNYDLFVWDNSGTLTLSRGPPWTSDTGRGSGAGTTQLAQRNGRYVNAVSITNGPGAERGLYVGTVRSDGSAQINDSAAKRHVWNMYNRVTRPMRIFDTTNTWTQGTQPYRQANSSTANQLDFVLGITEDGVSARALAMATNSTATARDVCLAIGLDSTTAKATDSSAAIGDCTNADKAVLQAFYSGIPTQGRHTLVWLESGAGTDTQTWIGDGGSTFGQSGLVGELRA